MCWTPEGQMHMNKRKIDPGTNEQTELKYYRVKNKITYIKTVSQKKPSAINGLHARRR